MILRLIPLLLGSLFAWHLLGAQETVETVDHRIQAALDPATQSIRVRDEIVLPPGALAPVQDKGGRSTIVFSLHEKMAPTVLTPGVELLEISQVGFKKKSDDGFVQDYQLVLPAGVNKVELQYAGRIMHPVVTSPEDYARGFGETPGIISEEGTYLAGSSYWYPRFGDRLVRFNMTVSVPVTWDSVSQGTRKEHVRSSAETVAQWEVTDPQDDIYLIAAAFTEYGATAASGIETMAFLRTPDAALADKYLTATTQYLDMYDKLIGTYPYRKFALVENFWETGYGMPSFTLLGSKIIRFPFIINSSYPHEILHNWWGNGVYVSYATGNWCEGLTSYLADHLIKEQSGGGVEYRRAALQKYRDFVSENNDFALKDFTERHSSATEAVGYGKALMFYHMLRVGMGDAKWMESIQKFYSDNRYRRAAYSDLKTAFERVSGQDLGNDFTQWVNRVGAPELVATGASARQNSSGSWELLLKMAQKQTAPAYRLLVPIAVTLEGRAGAFQTQVRMDDGVAEVVVAVPGKPIAVDVDPEFDIFRKLDRMEIPPAISQAFGARKALALIPAAAPAELRDAYRAAAETWAQGYEAGDFEIRLDTEVSDLPQDRSVWLFGLESRFSGPARVALGEYDTEVDAKSIRVGSAHFDTTTHSMALIVRHPANPELVLSWVAGPTVGAISSVGRKLMHYGKYSHLVFVGDEAKAALQGIWPTPHSPMSLLVKQPDGSVVTGAKGKLAPRPALVSAPSLVSKDRMMEAVRWMADPALKGRELGTAELDQVADFISSVFKSSGLQTYFQEFVMDVGAPKGMIGLKNVVGVLPGRNPQLPPVVLGAHYDHLGLGWPDTHQGDLGKVHPGADDNASGVAVLLDLARSGLKTERTLIFVAFTGEEAGLLGSRYFVATMRSAPPLALINLDTVGRLGSGKITIFGAGTAKEWMGILMQASGETSVGVTPVSADTSGSDQRSFIEMAIPGVQLFAGANLDYHRATDTADKIDGDGLVKVALFARQVALALGNRVETLTPQNVGGGEPTPTPQPPRKVYLGTVPDFEYAGKGFRIASVVADSPAEKAGLRAADIIVKMNDTEIDSLKTYGAFLKTLKSGDQVTILFDRESTRLSTVATVIER